ncbi:carbohydrate porin [Paracidovorax anthurii]|uniref:Carbohydrate-selective porin (OprB family) n=1 Tax=Paracidovorax anthurii TaxID=78229 RepID=A0A328YR79_9BURK|nr:carbohydrate porin [Paracidovorax anthurii]RAR76200.1 carbohydrate-selective porin (OprB family) [Paracidovorax anthurii]WCM93834.1 carbohydrate porin [Acidovorax sp. NCPPB 2350]
MSTLALLFSFPPRAFRAAALAAAALSVLAPPAHAAADDPAADSGEPPRWAVHAQSTYIWQRKPAFDAAYTGPNSLVTERERSYSFTATADLALRAWEGAQWHFNPEAAQGLPLSHLSGAGGLSNGELARSSGTRLKVYRARFFLLQRWNAGGETERIEPDFNEMGGTATARRWTLVAGNVSLLDYFDNNPYAKDPREQFFNWSFLTPGAWDYAADARGYTWSGILEYRTPQWAVRAGRALQPRESNGQALDRAWQRHYGDQVEAESDLPVALPAGPLRGRVLLFRNRAVMGAFSDALDRARATGGAPSVADVRRLQTKAGWALTLEAPLGEDAGVFLRASRAGGRQETYAFTEIDRQVSVGGQWSGRAWGRPADRVGAALAVNSLSASHRDYLAAGGQGAFLGDGALRYGSERVWEAYYRLALPAVETAAGPLQSSVSLGVQRIANPGYNRDRGPVDVYSARMHVEF